ncbi:MAG: 3-oxoacyl-[acyl-carrier-protein] reductase FabG [Alphaproteobacteria bacterium MarineAlpha5_Bin9]|nr:MAG: 3-oxoacyl-[acyl-carrier-protein] reductase FabG [Alphaproteobacteria bacterium MarineAlpha5_Bin9]|tara:strand:+ start:49825 stop:50565 length:741 start_codon:yes stop_codon:yes gene_type:complete
MNYNLQNKKVLITGASGGIGKSLCDKFVNNGCTLICTSSNEIKIEELKKIYGSNHFYYKIDLSNTSETSKVLKKISVDHNDIDILINNAGTTKDNLLLRMNSDQWQEVININLNSNFYIIKSILPSMIKNKKGCIIGISSVVALSGNPGQSNYTASKGGLISMYKSIALEVAQRNIRINIIAPGFIKTSMTKKLNEQQVEAILNRIPMKKLGSVEDISSLALFLSTENAQYITGQTFHVNGGMLMV